MNIVHGLQLSRWIEVSRKGDVVAINCDGKRMGTWRPLGGFNRELNPLKRGDLAIFQRPTVPFWDDLSAAERAEVPRIVRQSVARSLTLVLCLTGARRRAKISANIAAEERRALQEEGEE